MKRKSFHSLNAGVALAAAIFLTSGCREEKPAAPVSKPAIVRVAPLEATDRALPVRAVGVLARRHETPLSFKIGGLIDKIAVRAGDRVQAGQVLASLRLDEIDAQVSQARSALEKARRDLVRVENLQAGRVATLENLQDARTGVEMAEAQLKAAEFNQRYATITAPEAGSILKRAAEPGELAAPGRPIVDFAGDSDGWIIRSALSDTDVTRVRLGDTAAVDAFNLTGRLIQVAEGAEATTRTIPVEIAVDGTPSGLRSGQVVSVTLQPAIPHAHFLIPASALIEGMGKKASVFYVEPGTQNVRRATVELEALEGGTAHVTTALPADSSIVVSGAEYLRDGTAVEIKP